MIKDILKNHAKIIRGITFKPEDKCDLNKNNAVVCFRTKNIQDQLDESDLIAIPRILVKNEQKIVKPKDILVSSANSWNLVGKCCQVLNPNYPATAGGFISILRSTSNQLDPHYLYRWFSSIQIQRKLRSFGNQTTNISNLDHKRTLNLKIPLPTLKEQKRIARILDTADEIRAKRRRSIEELDRLVQSVFLDMFGDPVTNPKGWETTVLLNVGKIGTGSTPSRKKEDYYNGNIPWVKSTEVDWGYIRRTSEYVSEAGKSAARLKVYPRGSIVLALYGQGKTRGKAAILEIDATSNQACCILTLNKHYNKHYIFNYLKQSYQKLRSASRGGNQENLNLRLIKEFPLPIVPIEIQNEFSSIIQSIEFQKSLMQQHLTELDNLFASLQSRAFNGML